MQYLQAGSGLKSSPVSFCVSRSGLSNGKGKYYRGIPDGIVLQPHHNLNQVPCTHTDRHSLSKLLSAFPCWTARGCNNSTAGDNWCRESVSLLHWLDESHRNLNSDDSDKSTRAEPTIKHSPPHFVSVCSADFPDRFWWYLPATRPPAKNLLLQSYP